jgi:hypothetical protein
MAGAVKIERLRQFLRELNAPARKLLSGELERGVLRDDDIPGAEFMIQELRRLTREERLGASRLTPAARLFFKPLEPFLVDDNGDHRHPGRIARSSLDALWTYIRRDLLAADARNLAEEVDDALRDGDEARSDRAVRVFQARCAAAIGDAFRQCDGDDSRLRRMLGQVGTPRAYEDLTALQSILKGRDALDTMAQLLPLRIGSLEGNALDECKAMIESVAGREDDLFLHALLVVFSRLAAPWQLIRLGVKAAGRDTAARVAETQFGIGVTIVLAELERMAGELRQDLKSGGVAVGALLKTIHDTARGLRIELELPVDSTWGRTLSSLRGQIAELVRGEIEQVNGRVQALLRPRMSSEIWPGSVLEADKVDEAEALVEFAGNCRLFAGELALNDLTKRTYSELEQYLAQAMRALLDGLRQASPTDRGFRQSQADAAVRLCAKVFGPDYAAVLGKAADAASAGNVPQRKMRA